MQARYVLAGKSREEPHARVVVLAHAPEVGEVKGLFRSLTGIHVYSIRSAKRQVSTSGDQSPVHASSEPALRRPRASRRGRARNEHWSVAMDHRALYSAGLHSHSRVDSTCRSPRR